jgi:hypothetical protein
MDTGVKGGSVEKLSVGLNRHSITFGVLVCFFVFLSATPAFAGVASNDRPFLFSFDGADTTAGAVTGPRNIDIDYSTGDVYVVNTSASSSERVVDKFNADGEAEDFSPAIGSSLNCWEKAPTEEVCFGEEGGFAERGTDVAIDNSLVHSGRIYVSEASGPIHAFDSNGNHLWDLSTSATRPCGIAVDSLGHLWVVDGTTLAEQRALEFETAGVGPPSTTPIDSFPLSSGAGRSACFPAIDQSGSDFYVASANSDIYGFSSQKYVGGIFDSNLAPRGTSEITIDQSVPSGHVFMARNTNFLEFDSSGVQIGRFGDQVLGPNTGGVAYNPSLDRVYVSNAGSNTVEVFGPVASGPVPDVTSQETDAISRTDATAHGTINPQGLPNSYHFEWTKGEAQHLTLNATGGTFKLTLGSANGGGRLTVGSNVVTEVATVGGVFHVGDRIFGESLGSNPARIPTGTTITAIGAGTLTLSANAVSAAGGEAGLSAQETTELIDWNASAIELQTALTALPAIGVGNLSVKGTPADGTGLPGEYDIFFEGKFAGSNPNPLAPNASNLSGAGHEVTVKTITEGETWGTAESQEEPYPSVEPTDSANHSASLHLTGLDQNTTYDVRLVGTNTESHLVAYATPDIFSTLAPPLPAIENCSISEISTTTAHVACTIDPQEDTTTWKVQISTDSGCNEGFIDQPLQTISKPGPGPVGVAWELTGLLPAQTYCVRLVAANSGGTTASPNLTFQTLAIPPTEAQTAFAAPLTDTTARINGRVNPQGEDDITYRFEISDDGTNWTVRPDLISAVDARDQVVVGDDLTNLAPDTTYHYRLASASNSAGSAVGLPGEARIFKTRPTELPASCPNSDVRSAQHTAYLGECRGIELVNQLDKGDQHVRAEVLQDTPPINPDGQRAIWNVLAGAPGGNIGTGATFLSERTGPTGSAPNGWTSRALVPPATRQPGGGEAGGWNLAAATSDLSAFVFNSGVPALKSEGGLGDTLMGFDANQNELFSVKYDSPISPDRVDLSRDGTQVLFINPAPPHQLQDLFGVTLQGGTTPETISLMPDGQDSECGLDASDRNRSFVGGGTNPEAAAAQWRAGYHMIATSDASRVYFQTKPNKANGECEELGLYGIYVRNRTAKKGKGSTTLIDPGASNVSPQFIRATSDGTAAYYVTYSKCRKFKYPSLACEAPEFADKNFHPDVYLWEEATAESVCMTCVVADADIALNTRGVLVSDDFSHVYFESTKQLSPGEGKEGDLNLYVVSGGEVRFVADPNQSSGSSLQEALLSTDGSVLVFPASGKRISHQGLTADSVASSCKLREGRDSGAFGAPACEELFRYDDRDQSLECLSCRPSGITDHSIGAEAVAGPGHDFRLSADGETVVFVSSETLTPLDVNGSSDVYEWRQGVLRLISDGVTTYPLSTFASPQVHAVSADGANVFFSLVDPGLTGFEQDGFANLYDARVNGGIERPNPPAHCSEESCQGPLQAAPPVDQSASTGVSRGNAKRKPPCRRPKVRRRGRCVKTHSKRVRHQRVKSRKHKHQTNASPTSIDARTNPGRAK